ncbi:uncharacterized protein KZ484_015155 [Pholidichthys leucotaenia]
MSCSSACKSVHVASSSGEPACDSVRFSESLTHDQGQISGSELGLMEMTEVEYSHLQHIIQTHMEAQAEPPDDPDASFQSSTEVVKQGTGSTVVSPLTSVQAIDLSSSTSEDHGMVMPVEKTPTSYGEVPGFVLARIRSEESLTERPAAGRTSTQSRSRSAARVCLEKRFDTLSADMSGHQDIQSALLSHFLTKFQQSADTQEAVAHLEMQKWIKTDRAKPFEVSSSYVGGVLDMRGQVTAHMADPIKKNMVTPAVSVNNCSIPHSRPSKLAKTAPDSAGKSQSSSRKRTNFCMPLSERKERHNSKERERRKRIRMCCDELNSLVPFCESDTDKVTTLQWTTAFLRYINETYGDTLKKLISILLHIHVHISQLSSLLMSAFFIVQVSDP